MDSGIVGAFQFGAIAISFGGVALGAIIVGCCWGAANSRRQREEEAPERAARVRRDEAETALIEAAIETMRGKGG